MKKVVAFITFLPTLAYGQFHMIGDSDHMSDGCIQLTPDLPYSEGLAYYLDKLDLTEYFQIEFDIYFGDKDRGADGVAFVVHNDTRQFNAYGAWGEGLGYGRFNPYRAGTSISPSIAIEFDTYQNIAQNDPVSDHIAYLENGMSWHENFWNNGEEAFDLEDDYLHSFYFRWDPAKKEIKVFLDGEEVFSDTKDLVKEIFSGETRVIWGFTASTGREHNLQYFCLKRFAYNRKKSVESLNNQSERYLTRR